MQTPSNPPADSASLAIPGSSPVPLEIPNQRASLDAASLPPTRLDNQNHAGEDLCEPESIVQASALRDEASQSDAASTFKLIHTRVLHLVNGEHFSGAERVQSHLGRCLPQFGVAADFVCVKPGRFAELVQQQNGNWGRGFSTPMRGRFDLRSVTAVRKLIRENDYSILHAHTPRTAMIAAAVAQVTRVPWVYHVHSPAARDSSRQWINRINAAVEWLSLRNCSHLICVSNSLREDTISQGYKANMVSVVHNGVPAVRPERSHTPTPITEESKSNWTIGMVALMRPRKGLEIVLDALAILREQEFTVNLKSIGPFETPEYETSVNAKIESLGLENQIQRVGFTDDVPAELAKLDAMVLPSLFGEGLPMVVLEAMAAGLPVIATRVEGTPEAITDGVEGLLAEPQDPQSLAGKIRDLITGKHDWKTMSEAAAKRHGDDFSDVAMARGAADVYRRVLAS